MTTTTLSPGTYTLTPAGGTVLIHTGREGMAARVGHDLVLEVTSWTATVTIDSEDVTRSSVTATFDARSIEVREGTGGAMPLTDKDRADIRKNLVEKVLKSGSNPEITLRSTGVEQGEGGALEVVADLTMLGVTRPVRFQLAGEAGGATSRLMGRIPLVQSTWGIKPFSAMLGALKVPDRIEVSVDLRVPAA